jgi:hypothetical protein
MGKFGVLPTSSHLTIDSSEPFEPEAVEMGLISPLLSISRNTAKDSQAEIFTKFLTQSPLGIPVEYKNHEIRSR